MAEAENAAADTAHQRERDDERPVVAREPRDEPQEAVGGCCDVQDAPVSEAIGDRVHPILVDHPHWDLFENRGKGLYGVLKPMPAFFPEEQRSKQPSVFSVLRALSEEFRNSEDDRLSLIGAFGYDLAFQFEPVRLRRGRPEDQRDLVLHLPDELYALDRKRESAVVYRYEFTAGGASTEGLPGPVIMNRLGKPTEAMPR